MAVTSGGRSTTRRTAGFHSTSFVADRTIDFIERASAEERPVARLGVVPDPHHPFTPGRWYDRHHPDDMVLPDTFDDPMVERPST
ncbi:MAG: hypothetical protein R2697_03360 [Ilumatobacteraceae bacterium]